MSKILTAGEFKAIIASTLFSNGGGFLTPEQATEFITGVSNRNTVLAEAKKHLMIRNSKDIDRMDFARRQMRKHVTGVAGDDAAFSTAKRVLTLTETKVKFKLDTRTAEAMTILSDHKKINGKLMTFMMMLAQTQFINDMEDLAFNGDTTIVAGGDEDFLSITDGWLKQIKADAVTYDIDTGTDYEGVIFKGLLANIARRYRDRQKELRIYTTHDIVDAYIDQLGARKDNTTAYVTGIQVPTYKGIPVVGVSAMPDNHMILTNPKNLNFGMDINQVERAFDNDIETRTLLGLLYAPIGFQIADIEGAVVGYNAS